MTTALLISMAAFSLAASISPGPVNIVAMSAGMRHGVGQSMWFVAGATVGFTVLLVLVGLGLRAAINWLPGLLVVVRWAGVLFLGYMAVALATACGEMSLGRTAAAPSAMDGALLQWLNPKAWLASIAGTSAFAAGADLHRLTVFATIYFVICFLSVGFWAMTGNALRHWLGDPWKIRAVNRLLAALLAASAAYLAFAGA
ncbi:MAG: LysE family translocator [Oxalobacteraceae bacterium]|nr:MAG: LysE family translocator [Oxalobacteraceae bacterium]